MRHLPTIPLQNGATAAGPVRRPDGELDRADADEAERRRLLDIVARAQAGEMAAQTELVHRYSARVAGYVRPIIPDASEVEDVVQTVFVKVVRRLGLLREPQRFEAWLFRLARNTALDFYRRSRCRPALFFGEADSLGIPASDSARTVAEIMEALEVAATKLGWSDRRLITQIVHGHSYQTVAKTEGLTVGAVKLRLTRMRPFLRASVGGAIGLPTKTPANCRLAARYRAAA